MFFEISRKLTSGKSFRKFILSKCPNDWTITMIWRSFIGNLEILFLPKFQKKFLQKCDDHCIIPVTKQSFKPSREKMQFLLYRGFCFIAALTYLAIDLNILCRVNTAIKKEVSSTLLVSPCCIGTTLSEARKINNC